MGWGLNGNGQTSVPASAQGHFAAIAAGGAHSLALVENAAPRLTTPLQAAGYVGVPVVFTAAAEDADLPNDTLTYSLVNPPAGMTINSATGQLAFTPAAAGAYLACIRVTDKLGATDTAITAIEAATSTPTANAGADQSVTVPHDGNPATNTVTFTLNGSASSDSGNAPLTYQWKDQNNTVVGTTAQVTLSRAAGTYTFTLTVTNPGHVSSAAQTKVTVNPEPNQTPAAVAGANQNVFTPGTSATVTLDGSASLDPDGDPITYQWSEGNIVLANTVQPTLTLPVGMHVLTLTVTDSYGASGSAAVTVTVTRTNIAPILNAIPDQSVLAGQTLTFTPTLAQQGNNPPLTYSLVNAPSGVAIDNGTGKVSWTPTTAGTYTFSVKVTDAVGLSDTKPVNVTVTSDPNGTARLLVMDIAAQRVSANKVTVTFTLANAGTAALQNIRVTRGQLRTTQAQTPLPGPFGLGAGNRQSVTLTFTSTSAIASGYQPFVMSGSYQSGAGASLTFSSGLNINVP